MRHLLVRSQWLALALTASLSFNVGLVTTLLLTRGRAEQRAAGGPPPPPPLESLLPPDEAELVHATHRELFPKLEAIRTRLEAGHRDLLALLDTDRPDREQIAAQLDTILALQREAQEAVVESQIQVASRLDPEQRHRLLEYLRPPPPRHGRGPGGPGGPGGPPPPGPPRQGW